MEAHVTNEKFDDIALWVLLMLLFLIPWVFE